VLERLEYQEPQESLELQVLQDFWDLRVSRDLEEEEA